MIELRSMIGCSVKSTRLSLLPSLSPYKSLKRPLTMEICREPLSMSQTHQSDNGRVQLSPQAKQEVIDETIWGDVFLETSTLGDIARRLQIYIWHLKSNSRIVSQNWSFREYPTPVKSLFTERKRRKSYAGILSHTAKWVTAPWIGSVQFKSIHW